MNVKTKPVMQLYNELPRPTFRTIKVNNLELEPLPERPSGRYTPQHQREGDISLYFYQGNGMPDLGEFQGANAEALERALRHADKGCAIEAEAGAKGTARLVYEVNDDHPTLNRQLRITAGAGSDVTVYLVFEGGAAGGEVNFLHYIRAEAGAHVKIVKVQLHEGNVRHIEHRYAETAEGSSVEYVSAELGAKEAVVYYKTDLLYDESSFDSKSLYLGKDKQIVDFSYWIPMQGKKTKADVAIAGALQDEAKKAFRGTIDFLRGSKKAVGSEADTCILLSPKVHSISVPLLLCKEDDVVGNHASSAGQIDEDTLFYLMSRGFDYKGAQAIIVESHIRPVVDAIGDGVLAERVLQTVRERMNSQG